MRKFLFAIISILVLSLTIYVIIEGVSFAKVNGYKKITEINNELDTNIAKINYIKNVVYAGKEKELNTETKKLKETREEYLAKVEAARVKGAEGSQVQIEIYELDFIWARVGNYASDLRLEIKLDVFPGTEEKTLNDFKLYNLKFAVQGEYTDIVRFIYKLEGDNELSAQLSDFSMKPVDTTITETDDKGEERQTTVKILLSEFTLKNVPLNYKNILEDTKPKTTDAKTDDSKLPSNTTPETAPETKPKTD